MGERGLSAQAGGATVTRVDRCRLSVREGPWAFAREHAAAIDAHWRQRLAANPAFFDGSIYMLAWAHIADGVFTGVFQRVAFKAFLYWREHGEPAAGVRDGFGSGLLRGREGHVLIGRQSPGHLNAGLSYPPGGFIDGRDIGPGFDIDIDASISREITEETGLAPSLFTVAPGYLVTRAGTLVSIAREYRSIETAVVLRARAQAFLAAEANPELDAFFVVRNRADMGLPMPDYSRALIEAVFDAER